MNRPAWVYYLNFYRRDAVRISACGLVSAIQSLIVLPVALLIRYAFDHALPTNQFNSLLLVGLAILFLQLFNSGLTILIRKVTLRITKLGTLRMREDLLHKLYLLPRSYFSDLDRGKLHATLVQDSERLDRMSNAVFTRLAPALFTSLSIMGILIYLNWRLFLVMAAAAPVLVLMSKLVGRQVTLWVKKYFEAFRKFSREMYHVLQRMDLTRILAAEEWESRQRKNTFTELSQTSEQTEWLRSIYSLTQEAIIAIASILILIAGGRAVTAKVMSLGELISFYAMVAFLKPYLQEVSSFVPLVIEGNASLNLLFEMVGIQEQIPYTGTRQITFSGKIRLDSVDFGYTEQPVLRAIDLTIEPHESVALLGPNGSGKTTIAHLILGFYKPNNGKVLADELPYAELDMQHLRKQIGVVMQNPIIFPGTIQENISYGRPQVTFNEVLKAARLATADDFIQDLPHGYQTAVGEEGIRLSGGQRQRIAIGRALLGNPKLLILDEPTNHLDESAIRQLLNNLTTMEESPGILIISHVDQIVRITQRVYLLTENGHIAESGSAERVLAKNLNPTPQP